jgi:hypothetical protein
MEPLADRDNGAREHALKGFELRCYEQTATIVTSNLDFTEWGDAFANRLLGAATLDRLRHGAYRVVLDGESYRTPRPLPEAKKSTPCKRVQKREIMTPV